VRQCPSYPANDIPTLPQWKRLEGVLASQGTLKR
jgi:hypothetical protein